MLRLCRLSPAPAPALNVRFAAPGHANPRFLNPARFIDRNHPAAKLPLRSLPAVVGPQFTVHAFPNAILHEPDNFVPVNPILATTLARARSRGNIDAKVATARRLADAHLAALAKRGKHSVGLLFHTSKKATSKSCVIRRRLRSKMKTAIDLVISRHADAIPAPSGDQPDSLVVSQRPTPYPTLHLVTRPLQENESFVLKDWTYLVTPDLLVYKMPLPNLVQVVRKALLSLSQQMKHCEASWSKRTPTVKPQPAVQTRDPPRPHRQSEIPDKPPKDQGIIARLYAHRPIILPHGRT